MKKFKEYLYELKLKNTTAYHATKHPFKGDFSEKKIGDGNDDGYSGRGFYFFVNKRDVVDAALSGYMKEFNLNLSKVYNLKSGDDPFSEDSLLSDKEHRDQTTLRLLEEGYHGSVRYTNGRIEEICVFSYKSKGYDGNKFIKQIGEWIKY